MKEEKKPENPFAFAMISAQGEYSQEGMTLRDYFAAKAMQGLISHYGIDGDYERECPMKSFEIADTMLKQREL